MNKHENFCSVKMMEAMSAVELLSQEEAIVKRQLEDAVDKFTNRRTASATDTVARAALAHREWDYFVDNFFCTILSFMMLLIFFVKQGVDSVIALLPNMIGPL